MMLSETLQECEVPMDDKKSFVENELKNVLMKADSSIGNVGYINSDILGIEVVVVCYKNNTMKFINIAGDSEIGIIYDVSKRLLID